MMQLQPIAEKILYDLQAATGKEIELAADSICVHGDSPAALSFVKNIRQALTSHNIRIASIEETLANR